MKLKQTVSTTYHIELNAHEVDAMKNLLIAADLERFKEFSNEGQKTLSDSKELFIFELCGFNLNHSEYKKII